jgi:D-alanine-D-alanine ligase
MSEGHDRNNVPVLLLYNLDETWLPHEIQESLDEAAKLSAGLRDIGHPVTVASIHDTDLKTPLSAYSPDEHVVFNWCEGVPGIPWSDALVAETLETLGYAYTGASPEVLRLSQDKHQVKHLLDEHKVPTPRWHLYASPDCDDWTGFPAIVKPSQVHCSFGVTTEAVVLDRDALRRRIEYVLEEFHQPALVEDFVDGREFHASLWGNGVIQMLPPAEMDFAAFDDVRDRLCTFESKFDPDSRHYKHIGLRVPASLSESEYARLEQTAVTAYRAVGCRDYARLDIRQRDGVFYVLDVNPNADLSSVSSTAYAAEVAGYSFGAMGSRLVNLAARRHPVFGWSHPPAV